LIKEDPKRLAVGQLGELFELDALRHQSILRLGRRDKSRLRFERKNVGLNTLRQVARNTVHSDSGVRVVIGPNPGRVRLGIVHFGLIDRDEVSTVGRGVLVTPLDSGHGITGLPSPWFLSCRWALERG
jgi:hypothetical protein